MNKDIADYFNKLSPTDKEICELLRRTIEGNLKFTESKIWHAHPVYFIEGNPIVGFHKLKDSVRILFWSGQSFEDNLEPEGSFKAAEKKYTSVDQVDVADLKRWLKKSEYIQWDYKNILRRKGLLEKNKLN